MMDRQLAHMVRMIDDLLDVPRISRNKMERRRASERPSGRTGNDIALTGWGQDGDRERSREAGCDGHLVKPVDLAALQRVLSGAQ